MNKLGKFSNQDAFVTNSREIFKKGSTTYYYSSLFFTGQVKSDVVALYAYVRLMDDYVDQLKPDIVSLDEMIDQTVVAWKENKQVSNQVVNNFVLLAKRKKFEYRWIEAFWHSMKSDTQDSVYNSYQDLKKYIYGSAEVIGLMMAKILDLPKASYASARKLGEAMQFINMIRDVKEDEELGRNYLGYSESEKQDSLQWEAFVHKQVARYWKMQKEAELGYRYIPRQYLIPVKTAADMYIWTSKKIYNNPQQVWLRKLKPKKLQIFLTTIINSLTLR